MLLISCEVDGSIVELMVVGEEVLGTAVIGEDVSVAVAV